MSVRMHETNVGNRLPPVCNMPATGMQHVRHDSDVRLWRCRVMIEQHRPGQVPRAPRPSLPSSGHGHVGRRVRQGGGA